LDKAAKNASTSSALKRPDSLVAPLPGGMRRLALRGAAASLGGGAAARLALAAGDDVAGDLARGGRGMIYK
jgi:hypothetical protein